MSDDDDDHIANYLDEDNDIPLILTDVNMDGDINAIDIQAVINAALGK